MISVVCVKNGTKYGPEYVNRLYRAVDKHLTIDHEFVCLTDDPQGLECEAAYDMSGLPGWWAKMRLFDPHSGLRISRHKMLYFDLDTIILDSINFMGEYEGEFAILRDFYRPHGYGSGVMILAPWFGGKIWDEFSDEPFANMKRFPNGDQHFIESVYGGASLLQDFWPGEFISYKCHCSQGVPDGAAVLSFHGTPKNHDLHETDPLRQIWEGA